VREVCSSSALIADAAERCYSRGMGKVEAIEKQIESLAPEELAAFRRWFHDFDADAWDRQLEADARTGKLDALADEALQAYKSGKCTEI